MATLVRRTPNCPLILMQHFIQYPTSAEIFGWPFQDDSWFLWQHSCWKRSHIGLEGQQRKTLVSFKDMLGGSRWKWSSVPHLPSFPRIQLPFFTLVSMSSTQNNISSSLPGLLYAIRNYSNMDDLRPIWMCKKGFVYSNMITFYKKGKANTICVNIISSAIKQYLYCTHQTISH